MTEMSAQNTLSDDERATLEGFVHKHETVAALMTGATGYEIGLRDLRRAVLQAHVGKDGIEALKRSPLGKQREVLGNAISEYTAAVERNHSVYANARWLLALDAYASGDTSALIEGLTMFLIDGGAMPEWVRAGALEALQRYSHGQVATLDAAFGVDHNASERRERFVGALADAADLSGGTGRKFSARTATLIDVDEKTVRNIVNKRRAQQAAARSRGADLQSAWTVKAPAGEKSAKKR